MSQRTATHRGFTLAELAVVILVVAVTLGVALPTLARMRDESGIQESMSNLASLASAHVLYAWDWNGRQVTWTIDNVVTYGSVDAYNDAHDCQGVGDPSCHPSLVAGWGCDGGLYAYQSTNTGHSEWAFEPINFEDPAFGFGNYRLPNTRPLIDYMNGRMYDVNYYAPNDVQAINAVSPFLDSPCQFDQEGNPPLWSSYSMSPAAMFHPDVMRSNAAGGFQDPWSLDFGLQSPSFFQALYPDLKTLMIEQHWVQDPPSDCNEGFEPWGSVYECEPYHFNHGVDSTPLALFYDGQVRLFPNTEALAADQQILEQTEGTDGLWHRGTPFGENGHYIAEGWDQAPISHHILTTDGILGRDTLAETAAVMSASLHWDPIPISNPDSGANSRRLRSSLMLIVGEEP
jgi:prepilin-type N-terminal cleavage/methylation domain-containing protein